MQRRTSSQAPLVHLTPDPQEILDDTDVAPEDCAVERGVTAGVGQVRIGTTDAEEELDDVETPGDCRVLDGGVAVLVGLVRISATLQKETDQVEVSGLGGRNQRGPTALALAVDGGAKGQQLHDPLVVAEDDGLNQMRGEAGTSVPEKRRRIDYTKFRTTWPHTFLPIWILQSQQRWSLSVPVADDHHHNESFLLALSPPDILKTTLLECVL